MKYEKFVDVYLSLVRWFVGCFRRFCVIVQVFPAGAWEMIKCLPLTGQHRVLCSHDSPYRN